MTNQQNRYLKVVRASAWYDLLVTAPFALPVVSTMFLALLKSTHQSLGLSGSLPEYEAGHLLFVNLMGCLVLVWATLRLMHTRVEHGLYDGVARLLFAFCQAYYLFGSELSTLIVPFLLVECLFGAAQLLGFLQGTRTRGA
jgi:hypothetical protein